MKQTKNQLKKTVKNFTHNIYFQVPSEEYLELCYYLGANPFRTFQEETDDPILRQSLENRNIPYIWITKRDGYYSVEEFTTLYQSA